MLLYWSGAAWLQTQLDAGATMSAAGGALYGKYDIRYLDTNGQCETESFTGSQWTHKLLGGGGTGLTGGLSVHPSTHWVFARRSDGAVVIFYYQ